MSDRDDGTTRFHMDEANLTDVALQSIYGETARMIAAQSALASQSLDSVWLLLTTFSILFMQTGFLLLETGSVRAKNARSIMAKNLCDSCFGCIAWYYLGYYIYTGEKSLSDPRGFGHWMQSFGFACTTCTIVSGAVASRMKFGVYMAFSVFLCAWMYPWLARWSWAPTMTLTTTSTTTIPSSNNPLHNDDGDDGLHDAVAWLAHLGYKDFSGGGPVHMLGGLAGLVGAVLTGPRLGRFDADGRPRALKGHSDALVVLGGMILWFGWLSFNAGSSRTMDPARGLALAQYASLNTVLASSFGGAVGVMLSIVALKHQNLDMIVNSIIGSLVAITAGCAYVDPWAAAIIGAISPGITFAGSTLLVKLGIDDPVDASAVHFGNGLYGVLAVGLLDRDEGLLTTGSSDLLGTQCIAILFIILWGGMHTLTFFGGLKLLYFKIRVDKDDELVGLDFKYCDGYAYEYLDAHKMREQYETRLAEKRLEKKTMKMRKKKDRKALKTAKLKLKGKTSVLPLPGMKLNNQKEIDSDVSDSYVSSDDDEPIIVESQNVPDETLPDHTSNVKKKTMHL